MFLSCLEHLTDFLSVITLLMSLKRKDIITFYSLSWFSTSFEDCLLNYLLCRLTQGSGLPHSPKNNAPRRWNSMVGLNFPRSELPSSRCHLLLSHAGTRYIVSWSGWKLAIVRNFSNHTVPPHLCCCREKGRHRESSWCNWCSNTKEYLD